MPANAGFWRAEMTALGQTRSSGDVRVTSAFHPIATKSRTSRHFGIGPLATNAPQQTASLFNHVVSKGEQRRRHSEAERLGGLQVDE
jgi:hypothetical protein